MGVINEEDWEYYWMIPFLRSIPSAHSNKKIKRYLQANSVQFELPYRRFNWHRFMCEARAFFKENFLPFIVFLSGGISVFHYKKILKIVGTFLDFFIDIYIICIAYTSQLFYTLCLVNCMQINATITQSADNSVIC